MKKNIVYIAVPVLLLFMGIIYRYFFLADTIDETGSIAKQNKILIEKYNRDVFIQNNIANLDSLYERNKRGTGSYGDVIVELLGITERMLRDSEIKYEANKINQDSNEITDYKSGTASFVIYLDFQTQYKNVIDFIHRIETSDYVINISSLRMNRNRPAPVKSQQGSDKEEFDEFNVEASVSCQIKLEFVKYL